MKRSKYLDEIGLKYKEYGWDYKNSTKSIKKERKEIGFDPRECFNLNDSFDYWLYVHLKEYFKQANKRIDLTFHKFTVPTITITKLDKTEESKNKGFYWKYIKIEKGEKELTRKKCIKLMIDYLEKSFKDFDMYKAENDEAVDVSYEYSSTAVKIWAIVYPSMCW